jgi:hypothetical protein
MLLHSLEATTDFGQHTRIHNLKARKVGFYVAESSLGQGLCITTSLEPQQWDFYEAFRRGRNCDCCQNSELHCVSGTALELRILKSAP